MSNIEVWLLLLVSYIIGLPGSNPDSHCELYWLRFSTAPFNSSRRRSRL